MLKVFLPVLLLSSLLMGCGYTSSSNVYEMSPGLFTITATGMGATTADRVTDAAMGKAQAACASKGQRLDVVNQQQSDTRQGIDTTIALTFRCI